MIENLRLSLYSPTLSFNKRDLKYHDRDVFSRMDGSFHCIYTLPNSLLPRLHSRVILTTEELAIVTSRYDEGAVFSLHDLEEVEIQENYLRAYNGEATIEIEIGNSEGESFADIVLESWKDIKNEYANNLSDKEEENLEEQMKRFREREQEERDKND